MACQLYNGLAIPARAKYITDLLFERKHFFQYRLTMPPIILIYGKLHPSDGNTLGLIHRRCVIPAEQRPELFIRHKLKRHPRHTHAPYASAWSA